MWLPVCTSRLKKKKHVKNKQVKKKHIQKIKKIKSLGRNSLAL